MSVLVVGLSHRTTPVSVLERVSVSGDALEKLLQDVYHDAHVAEAMVVSTCNRVEVYAEVDKFHGGVSAVSQLLAVHSGVPLEDLTRHLYVHYEDRAVQHLFSVVSGLDSMVVGEAQILGQVRQGLRLAQERGTAGRGLNEVVQHALRVGKRAHSETGIDRVGASLVTVGLEIAARELGPLPGRRALVVGAGSMSALSAVTLARLGVTDIVVANRTYERAVRLAQDVGGRAARLETLDAELAAADVVISCTGATGLVITADMLAERRDRVFLLDLALPRDVDPAVRALPGVTLVDLETLQDSPEVTGEAEGRTPAVEAVRAIVCEEIGEYLRAARAATVTPTVVALRSKASQVVDAELARLTSRLPELDEKARAEVAQAVHRVVDKLLHEPTVRVKRLAASAGGDQYAAALRELFDLDPKAPEAMTRADVETDVEAGMGPGPGAEEGR
ncbi:glutamyl-tRNA reductase [Bailinhaonella thermotolerans]|uniref:Glutamyl-tRNA reductase n=1 Tax=Bailinhaonella thermotolerans TaxID=1070861 RepID=A0A3A4AMQ9_9ACTN|nr:glutamyl-tRNA reductase [Bailinhaonella thermotolerans]RJL22523.1 glutamyl-tRNA reductase [Bailinhaonella thermotolerans]